MKNRIFAMFTLVVFLLVSCSNGIDIADTTSGTKSNAKNGGGYLDELGIEFTGNPAYDIGLLNAYWDSEQNASLDSDTLSASRDVAGDAGKAVKDAAINGFGDLVKNFSGKSLLTWVGGTVLSSGISTLVSTAVTKLLDVTGIVKSTSSYLAEISGKLDKVQKQLNTMQTLINELNTEVQKQGDLTRLYTEMQKRNEKYNAIFTASTVCWNSINDMILVAALKSQYGEDTNAEAYKNKLRELDTPEKRLKHIQSFIDQDSWNATDNPELDSSKVNFASSEAGNKFRDYLETNKEALGQELSRIINSWGNNPNTGANSVINLCKYLTDTDHGLANESFNMFQLYDKYAETCFVWEREGYNWRQQMRDQDATIIGLTSALAYMYFSINEALGPDSQNCAYVKQYVSAALEMNNNEEYKVVRHKTPRYQKPGQWKGKIFDQNLESIDYEKISPKWVASGPSTSVIGWDPKAISNDGTNENNASRFYGGFEPPAISEWQKAYGLYNAATGFAMTEDWYKEIFDAYAYTDKKTGVVKHKSLLEIFKNAGFRLPDSKEIIVNIPAPVGFERDRYHQFFITNKYEYVKVYELKGDRGYLTVSVAVADNTSNVFVPDNLYDGIKDHTIPVVEFEGRLRMVNKKPASFRFLPPVAYIMEKIINPYSDCQYFYPKMRTTLLAEE